MGDPFSAQPPQAARERRPACSSGSLQSLQVGPYDPLDPAVPRMLKEVLDVPPRPPSPEPERLKDYVHAELVPELEGVGDRLLGAVEANWNAVDLVSLNALAESGPGELEDLDRWIVDRGGVFFLRSIAMCPSCGPWDVTSCNESAQTRPRRPTGWAAGT